MLPLYSCIIPEHLGIPGGEVQDSPLAAHESGRAAATCWFENPFAAPAWLMLLPSSSCQRYKTDAGHGTVLSKTDARGVVSKDMAKQCGSEASASRAIPGFNAVLPLPGEAWSVFSPSLVMAVIESQIHEAMDSSS